MKARVLIVEGFDARKAVQAGLKELGVRPREERVVIKPNLIANRPYPITTPPETVEALARFFGAKVLVAEGSGFSDTAEVYRDQGYFELARRLGVKLVDLNQDEFEVLKNPRARVLKRFELPQTLKGSYLVSAAVLKRHSITGVTLSLKNMLGATVGRDKGRFHELGIEESIVDICLYKRPDLAVIDGRLSSGSELGGEVRRTGAMIFSEDPVAADAVGAKILGLDPLGIKHLKLAEEVGLGTCGLSGIEIKRLRVY